MGTTIQIPFFASCKNLGTHDLNGGRDRSVENIRRNDPPMSLLSLDPPGPFRARLDLLHEHKRQLYVPQAPQLRPPSRLVRINQLVEVAGALGIDARHRQSPFDTARAAGEAHRGTAALLRQTPYSVARHARQARPTTRNPSRALMA